MTAVLTRAERKAQTREQLVDAAYRVFTERGFHGATVDLVAAEAGFTKGAVYSNFVSKEDLFFAVYERRVEQALPRIAEGGGRAAVVRTLAGHRKGDGGWMAVFFEFWAHVIRHPELRERFLAIHRRAQQPLVEATRAEMPHVDAERFTLAAFALVSGLGLELLTDPSATAERAGVELLDYAVRGSEDEADR
jgi:AcrR family transcriptional regulator